MSTTAVAFFLYLFTRLTAFSAFVTGLTVFLSIWLVGAIVTYYIWFLVASDAHAYHTEWHEEKKAGFYTFIQRGILPAWLIVTALHLFIPSKNDAMLIVGGAVGYHGVNAIASDERVQDAGGKAIELMNAWLDQQIAERKAVEEVADEE